MCGNSGNTRMNGDANYTVKCTRYSTFCKTIKLWFFSTLCVSFSIIYYKHVSSKMDPTLIQNFSTKHFPNRTLCKLYSLQQINLFRDKRQLKSNFDLTRWPTRVFKAIVIKCVRNLSPSFSLRTWTRISIFVQSLNSSKPHDVNTRSGGMSNGTLRNSIITSDYRSIFRLPDTVPTLRRFLLWFQVRARFDYAPAVCSESTETYFFANTSYYK